MTTRVFSEAGYFPQVGMSQRLSKYFGKSDVLLWALLAGGLNVHLGDRQPVLLYFDVILILWLFYQILWCDFLPVFSDRVVKLGIFCLMSGVLSAIVNYEDIFKTIFALKVLSFGILIYAIGKRSRPSVLSFCLWGAIVGVLLLANFRNIQFNQFENAEDMKGSVGIVLGQSNYVAAMLVLLIPLAVAGVTAAKGKLRFCYAGCAVLMFAGLIATMSRGAMLSTVLATLLSLPLLFRAGMRIRHILVMIAVGVIVIFMLPQQLLDADALLIANRFEHVDRDREDLLLNTWKSFIENPILGVGPGQIGNAITAHMVVPDDNPQFANAHNLVLNALAENGIFAGIALLSMVGIVLFRALKAAITKPSALNVALWIGLAASVMHNMVEAPFEGQQFQVVFWFVAAMAGGAVFYQPLLSEGHGRSWKKIPPAQAPL